MLVLARWIHFSSVVVVFGGSAFWLYMDPRSELAASLPWSVCAATRIIRVAAPLAALSGLAWLLATIANMTGDASGIVDPGTLHAFFFETPFGALAFTRLILLAGLVLLTLSRSGARTPVAALAAISALLLVSQAWLGHAAEGGGTPYGAAMIVAYAVHVLAGAAWVGGLFPLLFAMIERGRGGGQAARTESLRLLSRYSAMAALAVSLIVVTGVANAAFRVGGAFGILASTGYGDVLLVKVGLVAVMLSLAAFNRFVMMPRLNEAPGLLGRLRGSIALETILGLVVLAAAAVLGVTPPPQ